MYIRYFGIHCPAVIQSGLRLFNASSGSKAASVLIAGLLFSAVSAQAALTVTAGLTVTNACNRDIVIAVHYKGSGGGWITTPFVSIPANRTMDRVVSSDNSIFYYYAESQSDARVRWTGDNGFKVNGRVYPMKKAALNWDEGRNRYHLRLTCS